MKQVKKHEVGTLIGMLLLIAGICCYYFKQSSVGLYAVVVGIATLALSIILADVHPNK